MTSYKDLDSQMGLSESQEQKYLCVSVKDSGCGMNSQLKQRCFTTLFGNLKFRKDNNQGRFGIGLAASSLICKALNGELHLLKSQENEGSKF